MYGMTFHPRGECCLFRLMRLLAVSGSIDIPFALEIHLSIPTCRHGTDRRSTQKNAFRMPGIRNCLFTDIRH
jgi:hypothetical protein